MSRPNKGPVQGAVLAGLALAAAATILSRHRPPALTEAERPPDPALREAAPPVPAGPAGPGDVAEALRRVFDGCVIGLVVEPRSVIADLNGDGSEDLAVRVQAPRTRLREVNHDLANWMVQDLDPRRRSSQAGSKHVEAGERLLAVIHGHGPGGWRSPEARQAHLLRSAGGVELKRLPRVKLGPGEAGRPRPRGDVLAARIDGVDGFLYWTGARYSLGR